MIGDGARPGGDLGPRAQWARALQATVGASLKPGNGPLRLGVGYRFERYDIDATSDSPERYEQFRGLLVEASLRIGR